MKTTQTLGVILRTVGSIVVVLASGLIIHAILSLLIGGPRGGLLFCRILAFILGLCLLRGARSVVSFDYPEESGEEIGAAEPSGPATVSQQVGPD